MFVDARTIPSGATLETDICIIGAGAAGITLAREFAGRDVRVSVLESGGREFDAETQAMNEGRNIGTPYFPLGAARLRYFGGTTNHWGGLCRPSNDIDFESRSWVPDSGWPLTKAELQPYYDRAQLTCGVPSAEWDRDYWIQRDRYKPLTFQGSRLETRVVQVVPRAQRRFAANYRQELEQAGNLTTYLYANVTELETNETGNLVGEAHVSCLSGNRFKLRARYFVLATGAIENARSLLNSNRRHATGLGNQHDVVGRYFMEHPRLVTGILVPANRSMSLEFYSPHRVGLGGLLTQGDEISGYVALAAETLRKEQILDVQMSLAPVYDPAYAACTQGLRSESVASTRILLRAFRHGQYPDDLGKHLTNVLDDMARWRDRAVTAAPIPLPAPEAISRVWQADPDERTAFLCEVFGDIAAATYMEAVGRPPLDQVEVTTRVEQAPNPNSRVTLDTERDRLGLNKAQLNWQLSELDKRSMIRALEILGAEVGAAGIGRLQIILPEGDTWPETLRGGWHLMGTTRMSDNPRKGVVDRNCQVHGVHNLFIAGCSVFPTAGSGTPTLTLVGLAMRLADHLKARMT